MTPLFDSHAHYDDEKFDCDRDELLSRLTEPCEENPLGIAGVINCASDLETSRKSLALAEKYGYISAAVGVHPHEADSWETDTSDAVRRLAAHEKCVAVGEIGLDYHYDFSPREKQKEVFRYQLALARELGKPVIIHDREAHGDTMEILREFPEVTGVLHAFSGSAEMARELVKMGYYIAYGGSVTFKNADRLAATVSEVPDDRLLIETDSPYLAPVPYRGRRNTSALMYATAVKLSELRGLAVSEIANLTRENAARLFNL